MRAARLVGLGEVVCDEVALPEPAPGQALVRTLATSVTGDVLQQVFQPPSPLPYPLPPGYPGRQSIARVVWSAEPALSQGQEVLTVASPPQARGFADYQMLDASRCLPLPEAQRSRKQWLLAHPLSNVLSALAQVSQRVEDGLCVVLGQGRAGSLFSSLLRQAGARRVIASDPVLARRAWALHHGCHECVAPEELLDVVLDESSGRGADLVVEATGRTEALTQMVEVVAAEGALLGFGTPETSAPVRLDYASLFRKRVTLYTAFDGHGPASGSSDVRRALSLVAQGTILNHAPSRSYDLTAIDTALRLAREHPEEALHVHVTCE